MDINDIDRALRELGVSSGIEGFKADAAKWAKQAKECQKCKGWAILDENEHCTHCA